MRSARIVWFDVVNTSAAPYFVAAPFTTDGKLLQQQAVAIPLSLRKKHYVGGIYASPCYRYFLLRIDRAEAPPEIGFGDPTVQSLVVDFVRKRILNPPLRYPRFITPIRWSPSGRYVLGYATREVPAWQVDAEGTYVELFDDGYRLLDLRANRFVPLPKPVAHATVVGFFADAPDTLWALKLPPEAANKEEFASGYSLDPAESYQPHIVPVERWVYRVPTRRLEQMTEAEYRELLQNWQYLHPYLGELTVGWLVGNRFHHEAVVPLRDQVLKTVTPAPIPRYMRATVEGVSAGAALLRVSHIPPENAPGAEVKLYLWNRYYLAERGRSEVRSVGFTRRAFDPRLMEIEGRPHLLIADGQHLFLLDGRRGYFEEDMPEQRSPSVLRVQGAIAQLRHSDMWQQVEAWLRARKIRATIIGEPRLLAVVGG